MRQATADDWEITPLPDEFVDIALNILFTEQKSNAIKQGYIPEEMEEKWFCYFKNDCLYQHRSWSGFCIDVIRFEEQDNKLRAISARVNRNPDQYSNVDNEEDVKRITEMLDWLYK